MTLLTIIAPARPAAFAVSEPRRSASDVGMPSRPPVTRVMSALNRPGASSVGGEVMTASDGSETGGWDLPPRFYSLAYAG